MNSDPLPGRQRDADVREQERERELTTLRDGLNFKRLPEEGLKREEEQTDRDEEEVE